MLKTTFGDVTAQYNNINNSNVATSTGHCYRNTTSPTPQLDTSSLSDSASIVSENSQSSPDVPLALTSKNKNYNFPAYNGSSAHLRNSYGYDMESYENFNPYNFQQHQQQQAFSQYQNILANRLNTNRLSTGTTPDTTLSNSSSTSVSLTPSPPHQQQRYSLMNTNRNDQPIDYNTNSRMFYNQGNNSTNESNQSLPLKKRRAIPVEHKDNHYWEKRRKNNESAKRSRDIKREKESHLFTRNQYLEQENVRLRTQVTLYEAEIEKLRCLAYGLGNGTAANSH